jgi:hypothetical protein
MYYLLFGVIFLGIVAALIGYFGNRNGKKAAENAEPTLPVDPECCGQHEICERDSLSIAAGQKIEYYEDEELDSYAGIASDAHSDTAIREFEDVLYTLRKEEVADWLHSLQLRRINLPDLLKDEAFFLLNENRRPPDKM